MFVNVLCTIKHFRRRKASRSVIILYCNAEAAGFEPANRLSGASRNCLILRGLTDFRVVKITTLKSSKSLIISVLQVAPLWKLTCSHHSNQVVPLWSWVIPLWNRATPPLRALLPPNLNCHTGTRVVPHQESDLSHHGIRVVPHQESGYPTT